MSNNFPSFDHSTKFRNASNVLMLRALFYEVADDNSKVIFTLKDKDITFETGGETRTAKSIKNLYLNELDPTEYKFAVTHLDGWDHWCRLRELPWLKDHVAKWREELEIKIQSQALAGILVEAKFGKTPFAANKFLLETGWKPKDSPVKGRPTKEKIQKEANALAEQRSEALEDYERIKSLTNLN